MWTLHPPEFLASKAEVMRSSNAAVKRVGKTTLTQVSRSRASVPPRKAGRVTGDRMPSKTMRTIRLRPPAVLLTASTSHTADHQRLDVFGLHFRSGDTQSLGPLKQFGNNVNQ
jgi:hypothetical protein